MHAERTRSLLGSAWLRELLQHRLVLQHEVQQRQVKTGDTGLVRSRLMAIVGGVFSEQVSNDADPELSHLVRAFGQGVLQLEEHNSDQVVPRAEVRGQEELGANVCEEERRKERRGGRETGLVICQAEGMRKKRKG